MQETSLFLFIFMEICHFKVQKMGAQACKNVHFDIKTQYGSMFIRVIYNNV